MTTPQPIRVPVVNAPVTPHTGPAPDTSDHRDPYTRPAPQSRERDSAIAAPRPPDATTRPTAATGHAATRGDV